MGPTRREARGSRGGCITTRAPRGHVRRERRRERPVLAEPAQRGEVETDRPDAGASAHHRHGEEGIAGRSGVEAGEGQGRGIEAASRGRTAGDACSETNPEAEGPAAQDKHRDLFLTSRTWWNVRCAFRIEEDDDTHDAMNITTSFPRDDAREADVAKGRCAPQNHVVSRTRQDPSASLWYCPTTWNCIFDGSPRGEEP